MTLTAVLAIDGGQSGSRASLRSADGEQIGEIFACNRIITDNPVIPQLAELITQLHQSITENSTLRNSTAQNSIVPTVDTVAIGTTGLLAGDTASELLVNVAQLGVRRVLLAHDSVTSYTAALGADHGVMTAAGTGVVTLAVGAESTARVDGWGYLMGDCGSGYWIGRAGLEAGMRNFDGRGPATGMLDAIRSDFSDPSAAYIALQGDSARVARVASYCRVVAELADGGDAICQEILNRAGNELALSAATALGRVAEPDNTTACALGSVFSSEILKAAFCEELTARRPGVTIVPPRGVGLDGAHLLARLPTDHPLHRRVDLAVVGE